MSNGSAGYKKLIVWQVSNELADKVYQITARFPKHELYGITSQLRRAALSVPLNIVEEILGITRTNLDNFSE